MNENTTSSINASMEERQAVKVHDAVIEDIIGWYSGRNY
jgi:hypothetical protein